MLLSLAHKELVLIAALFLTAGLLISYIKCVHGQKFSVSHIVNLPWNVLSCLPLVNHLFPQTAAQISKKAENSSKKVNQFRLYLLIVNLV